MKTSVMHERVAGWCDREPRLGGTLAADMAELTRHTADGEELLGSLPPKPDRDQRQQHIAEQLLTSCRRVRNRVALRHADDIYDALTGARATFLQLPEILFAAAEAFPGLVPTRAQLDAERRLIQAHKDGREIDQGIFVRGLLRSRTAGRHLADAMLLPSPQARKLLGEFRRTGRVDLGPVLIERDGSAAHLTVCNQHCLNAEDDRLIESMGTAVDLALLDERVRVGVVRGGFMSHPRYAGKRVFSAGINLIDLRNGDISFAGFLLGRELGYISKLVHGVLIDPAEDAWPARTVQKPWLAVVDSFAIGGGMQLLLVFDRVIAANDAYFSLPAADEGIIPGLGNLRLSRLTGGRLARRIILGGDKVWATDPEARLLCDEVLPTTELDGAAERAIQQLGSPAVAANRRMLNLAEEPPRLFRAYLAEFAVSQVMRLYSPDVIAKLDQWWARSRAQ